MAVWSNHGPLLDAIEAGNPSGVKFMLDGEAGPGKFNPKFRRRGKTLIQFAFAHQSKLHPTESYAILRMLLSAGAVCSEEERQIIEEEGFFTLHELCSLERLDLPSTLAKVRERIRSGSNANATNEMLETPLHLCAKSEKGGAKTRIQVARELIQQGGAQVEAQDILGRTPLHSCIMNDNIELASLLVKENKSNDDNIELASLLVKENKSNVSTQDKYKRTPLFYAQSSKCADILLQNGADVSTEDHEGNIMAFYKEASAPVLHHLVDKGYLSLENRNRNGETVFFKACSTSSHIIDGRTGRPYNDLVRNWVLLHRPNPLDENHQGITPFMAVCARANMELVQFFIAQYGSSIAYRANSQGITPIMVSIGSVGFNPIFKLLVENGADPFRGVVQVWAKKVDGPQDSKPVPEHLTPFMALCGRNYLYSHDQELIRYCVSKFGASILNDSPTTTNMTPLFASLGSWYYQPSKPPRGKSCLEFHIPTPDCSYYGRERIRFLVRIGVNVFARTRIDAGVETEEDIIVAMDHHMVKRGFRHSLRKYVTSYFQEQRSQKKQRIHDLLVYLNGIHWFSRGVPTAAVVSRKRPLGV